MRNEHEPRTITPERSYEGFLSPLGVDDFVKKLQFYDDNLLDLSILALQSQPNFQLGGFIVEAKKGNLSHDYLVGLSLANNFLTFCLPEDVGPAFVNIFNPGLSNILVKELEAKKVYRSKNPYYFEDLYSALTRESRIISQMDKVAAQKGYLDYFRLLRYLQTS